MIKVVTDTYGVSYTAAAIRTRRQGLLMKEWQYDQDKNARSVIMKEPGTSQNGDRFGTFVKRIRQKDPREITSIRLADYLGISPTRSCDIEATDAVLRTWRKSADSASFSTWMPGYDPAL